MSDSISREAAIDTLESGKDKTAKGDIGGFYNAIIQNDIDKLRNLPSAQPEVTEEAVKDYCRKRCLTILTNDYFYKLTSVQLEIVRCKDCKFYREYGCQRAFVYPESEDFCSRAERREV